MYEEKLQNLGLTKGESKVYEALLLLGSSTVGPIVKKSGVAYSKIYEIINRLIEKGLASFIVKEKTKYFQAEDPTRINDYLKKREQELQKNRNAFQNLLPNLEKLGETIGKKEEAEIFIGEKGLLTAFEKLFKNSKKTDKGYFFYVHDPEYYERAEKFYVKTWKLIAKYGNKWRGLTNESFRHTHLTKNYPKNMQQKYVEYPLPGIFDIINDKVLMTSWRGKPLGILIHSKEFADNFINYFESVWKEAK